MYLSQCLFLKYEKKELDLEIKRIFKGKFIEVKLYISYKPIQKIDDSLTVDYKFIIND